MERNGIAVLCSALLALLLKCNDLLKEFPGLPFIYLDTWLFDKLVDCSPFEL